MEGSSIQAPPNYSSTNTSSSTTTQNANITSHDQPPLIQYEGQTYGLPYIIYSSMRDSDLMKQFVPILVIAPFIENAAQSDF